MGIDGSTGLVISRRRGFALALSAISVLLIILAGCGSSVAAQDSGDDQSSRLRSRSSRTSSDSRSARARSSASTEGHGTASAEPAAAGAGHGATDSGDAKVEEGHGSGPQWTYEGKTGPSYWGDLADEFIACKAGTSQSPINIDASIQAQPANIEFNYQNTPLSILNNGHTLQVNYAPGSSITIGHDQYELLQFHFHTPSEHEVSSQSFPMEGHLVHKDARDRLAVVGVFIEEGHSNPFFQALVDNLPHGAGEEKAVHGAEVNVEDMLPHDRDIFTYSGSLTTPPCSEGVSWNVMSTPIEMSGEQIEAFSAILARNNRPIQELNGRLVSNQAAGGGHGATATDNADGKAEHAGSGGAPHWSYEGKIGPSYWGDLADEFIACKTGMEQSPINIETRFTVDSSRSVFTNYGDTIVTILNNGHTIQVDYDSGSVAYLDGQEYELLQFHFHTPSENFVNDEPYPMEMHLVHKNAEGGLGVIGVLFEAGEENPLFARFWDFLPRDEGNVPSDLRIRITEILPDEPNFFTFDGSLTTPPCSEGVKWYMMQETVTASKAQMDKFMSIFGGNARPVQPLNGRLVGEF